MNEQSIFVLTFALIFWLVGIPSHRTTGLRNKVHVPRVIAMLAGSRDEWVNWRSFSFQLGFLSLFLWYVFLSFLGISNLGYAAMLGMFTVLGLQWLFQRFTNQL